MQCCSIIFEASDLAGLSSNKQLEATVPGVKLNAGCKLAAGTIVHCLLSNLVKLIKLIYNLSSIMKFDS